MRSRRRWGSPLFALATLAAAVATMAVFMPAPLCSDATGCTRLDNRIYRAGACQPSSGNGCYRCEVNDSSGTRTCFEAPDPADGSSCLDQRDTDWSPWD